MPPLSGGFAGSGYAGWRRGKPHMPWLVERLKAQGVDVSLPENIAVLDEVVAICEPVDLRPPCPFRLLCTNRYLEYVKGLARKVKRKGKFDRARALMDAHQQLVNLQARSQRHCRPSESEEAEVNCCECCSYIVHYLVRVVGNDVATFKYARAERVGGRIRVEYSAPARWRLIHDHVHWSEMHRMWVCKFCNEDFLPLIDAQDDEAVLDYLDRAFVHTYSVAGGAPPRDVCYPCA